MPWMARLRDEVHIQDSLERYRKHVALGCAGAVAWRAVLVDMAGWDSSHHNSGIQEVLVAAERLGTAVSGLDTATVDRDR